jgi:hypothetical protein
LGLPASGLIAVKLPVSDMYAGARNVIIGQVVKVNAETGAIEASAEGLRGTLASDIVRFKLEGLPTILADVKPGVPFVLLTGRDPKNFALHLADTWLIPEPTPTPQLFAVRKEKDLKQSYPGTTAALIKIVESKAANKYDMLDKISEETAQSLFRGPAKPFGQIDVSGTTALIALRGAGKTQSILARNAHESRAFIIAADGLKPGETPTPSPQQSTAALIAADADGHTLTQHGELMFQSRPLKLWSDGSTASAAAFGNFGEEPDKLYAIVIKDDNIYRYPLDGQGQPADFVRLTGERVSNYHKENPKWLAGATAAALDCNGDGRMDLLINTPSGPLLLINRGFGAFFIDADLGKVLKTASGAPLLDGKSLWTAADVDGDGLDDLLIVSPTGAVTAVMNPKPEKKP